MEEHKRRRPSMRCTLTQFIAGIQGQLLYTPYGVMSTSIASKVAVSLWVVRSTEICTISIPAVAAVGGRSRIRGGGAMPTHTCRAPIGRHIVLHGLGKLVSVRNHARITVVWEALGGSPSTISVEMIDS